MKREDFKEIIKLRSQWKITGENYTLPSNEQLSAYVQRLVESQLELDHLAILENGDLAFCTGGNWDNQTKEFESYELMPAYKDKEICDYYKMEKRINALVYEIVLG